VELVGVWTAWAWIGWGVTTAILVGAYVITGWVGTVVFTRLKRIYALHVIGYWLDRFEKEGLRTFRRPD
jgi:hypothetical protein